MRSWGLVMAMGLGACATAGPTSASPTETPGSPSSTEAEDSFEARHAALDREIDMQRRVIDESDGEARARAHFAIAEAYAQHLSLVDEEHYTLATQPVDPADTAARAEWMRANEAFTAQRHQWLEHAEDSYGRAVEDPALPAELKAEARYGRALARGERGDKAGELEDLEIVVREHLEHPLAGPAALRLADDAFDRDEKREARHLYRIASNRGDIHSQLYARYRLGWLDFNRNDHQSALDRWVDVVLVARTLERSGGLADSAAKDCVLAYIEVGRPESAVAFFHQLHPEKAHTLLQTLVEMYRNLGRTNDAEAVGIDAPPPAR